MIYESRREKRPKPYDIENFARRRADYGDPDAYLDHPLEYPSASEVQEEATEGSKFRDAKETVAERTSSAAGKVKEKLSQVGEAAKEKAGELADRAGQLGARVRDKTKETYEQTKDRVVETADEHPLEVGLIALAAGLIAGLALPTPNAVNRTVGPAADRLRERTRQAGADVVRKGKRVAEAAVTAVKDEAKAQGLTPERLREKAGAVAERAQEAGSEAAEREGLTSGSEPSGKAGDPSVARPAV
jgi:hypothetical protein